MPRASAASRGSFVLLALLVVVGSPWVQRLLFDYYLDHHTWLFSDEKTAMFVRATFMPSWQYSPRYYDGVHHLVAADLMTLLLFAGIVLLPSRLPARVPRWLRCVLGGVLASVLVNLLLWAAPDLVDPDAADWRFSGEVLGPLVRSALVFGLAVGLLLALLTAGAGRNGRTARRHVRPQGHGLVAPQERGRIGMQTVPTTVQRPMPVGSAPGDVTRYLCAAAYTDEGFADRVVEEVLADEAGAVAPSPGVDLKAVVDHCLNAREIRHRRDLHLTGAFVLLALTAPLWLVLAMVLLNITRSAGVRPSLAVRGRTHPERRALVKTGITAGFAVLLAFYIGAVVSSVPMPAFVSWLFGAYLAGVPAALAALCALAFAYATVVRHDLGIDRLLRTTLTRGTFGRMRSARPGRPRPQWIADRIAAVAEAQEGNVTVYSGYTPWIGYSETRSKWLLTVPLLPADDPVGTKARPAAPRPFTVTELVGHVRERLQAAAAHGAAGDTAEAGAGALGSLVVEDRIFVNGTTVKGDERFAGTSRRTPAVRLSAETVEQIMLRPTGTARHCLAVHVPLWGGDVVPSVLLHFATTGRTLHLHIDVHVLGPVHGAYHSVDRLRGDLTPEARRGLLMDALGHTGRALFGAPFRVRRHASLDARHRRRTVDELKAMRQDPLYDHGARVSIREMALSPEYHNYFQVVDADEITLMVERHTLAAMREFLDSHGYDTADFRAQQQTILNQGVIQQGGTSIIGNQAIGTGATATQNLPQQSGAAAPSPAGGSTT
ncbi:MULTISPECIES: hypothetical protein [Streptomyces]|uniref:hypothetical protein n=1 Tax=Streptomyces TaxID=1883 RepID=UPI001E5CEBC7|nr:hypothetical protein [Streptomyces ruber]